MMKLMSKMNCGIIYAVKQNLFNDRFKSIAAFMNIYTDTPIDYYTPDILEHLLSNAIAELLENLEHPSSFWFEYRHWKKEPWNMSDFDAMCAALAAIPVKNNELYINGFRPIEEFEFSRTKN